MTPDYTIDNGDEGEYLSDILDDGDEDDNIFVPTRTYFLRGRPDLGVRITLNDGTQYDRAAALTRYEKAKAQKVGETVCCPTCQKSFTKRQHQQAFCSNKGAGNCKDIFWNRASPDRAARAKNFVDRRNRW